MSGLDGTSEGPGKAEGPPQPVLVHPRHHPQGISGIREQVGEKPRHVCAWETEPELTPLDLLHSLSLSTLACLVSSACPCVKNKYLRGPSWAWFQGCAPGEAEAPLRASVSSSIN